MPHHAHARSSDPRSATSTRAHRPAARAVAAAFAATLAVGGCGGPGPWDAPDLGGDDLDMRAEDFTCHSAWPQVGRLYVTNLLGREDEAVAVAQAGRGTFPVGTVIQAQPTEAMVKRRAGYDDETNDWEYFVLGAEAGRTTIEARGAAEVSNAFGSCNECHRDAGLEHDFICQDGRGCEDFAPPVQWAFAAMTAADSRCGGD